MQIKLLNKGYKNDEKFYEAFLSGDLTDENKDFVSDEYVEINSNPDFPIYMGYKDDSRKNKEFKELIKAIEDNFLCLDREIMLDELFWHSYLCLYKRDYIMDKYPEIKNSHAKFKNVVIKKFDWENYIYKAILITQYTNDFREKEDHNKYYNLMLENMDLFNYIIKYEIFRNGQFLLNVLDIIDEMNLSNILKAKIKETKDSDQRFGRKVIEELNRSYPIVMSPMLEKEELKVYFMKYLKMYYKGDIPE